MTDVARLAGVSLGTVSHVLNGKVAVSNELRSKVDAAVQALGYQPSQMARALRRNRSDLLGMIIPDIANPFFPTIVRGAEDAAYRGGFRLLLCNSDNDPIKELGYLQELRSFRPAGLVVIPSDESGIMSQLAPEDPPIVFADRRPAGWNGDSVESDSKSGAEQATRYLLEMGHRRIAIIGGPAALSNARQRLSGFRNVIQQAGINLPLGYLEQGGFTQETGFAAMTRLLALRTRPTAVFASNDLMAAGALRALHKLGLRCPEEISLIGFDDLEFTSLTQPALSTVHQQSYSIGAQAVTLLLERATDHRRPPVNLLLPTSLAIRESVNRRETTRRR